jgi:hypothetical protein
MGALPALPQRFEARAFSIVVRLSCRKNAISDENFPLPLYRRLREKGYDAEHVIVVC